MDKKLIALADDIEASFEIDDDLAKRVSDVFGALSIRPASREALNSTDMVLDMIHALRPGWSVKIHGQSNKPNGHWKCSLRKSASRDNDEYVGIGRGPTLPHALLASLLRVSSPAIH